ncbi:hypothetical protein D9M70_653510 [compost metagenome]
MRAESVITFRVISSRALSQPICGSNGIRPDQNQKVSWPGGAMAGSNSVVICDRPPMTSGTRPRMQSV